MTGLEIGLLIIGAVFFIGSFFVSEKLSSSDLSEIEGLSEDQIKIILDKKMNEAQSQIDDKLEESLDEKKEEFASGADKETNTRIMSIGEYADTVYDSMNKTHEEILFLYQMLNDKQESLTHLTKTLGEAESHVRSLLDEARRLDTVSSEKTAVVKETDTVAEPVRETYVPEKKTPVEDETDESEDTGAADTEETSDTSDTEKQPQQEYVEEEAPTKKSVEKEPPKKSPEDSKLIREQVISMYHQGYSELEIAKETGKGIGEIKLILELFDEKEDA